VTNLQKSFPLTFSMYSLVQASVAFYMGGLSFLTTTASHFISARLTYKTSTGN